MASSRSSDRVGGGGGARNMKSMRPPLVVMFLMTYFYRAGGGGMAPSPPGSAIGGLKTKKWNLNDVQSICTFFDNKLEWLYCCGMLIFQYCSDCAHVASGESGLCHPYQWHRIQKIWYIGKCCDLLYLLYCQTFYLVQTKSCTLV